MMAAVAIAIAAYAALFGGIYAVVTRPIDRRFEDVIDRLKRIEATFKSHGRIH